MVAISASTASGNDTSVSSKVFVTNGTTKPVTATTTTANTSSPMDQYNKNVRQAIDVLKASDIVCFDVDSTVIKEEGIDELAKFCGKGAEVEKL